MNSYFVLKIANGEIIFLTCHFRKEVFQRSPRIETSIRKKPLTKFTKEMFAESILYCRVYLYKTARYRVAQNTTHKVRAVAFEEVCTMP